MRFSCKIYPEMLDIAFLRLYLCSVVTHHEVHRVPQSISIFPLVIQTTEGRKDLGNIHVDVHEILRR